MRIVLQRVNHATVTVDGERADAIEHGLLLYVAAAPDDGPDDVEWLVRKVAELRIFDDEVGRMNR